jgi:hypothetical protein
MTQAKECEPEYSVVITPQILGEITMLVQRCDKEVGWLGDLAIERTEKTVVFTIKRVYLFPQVVTEVTVRNGEIKGMYGEWFCAMLDNMTEPPIMQYYGHSHVYGEVRPSPVDIRDWQEKEGTHLYSIHNKRGEALWEIWEGKTIIPHEKIKVVYASEMLALVDEFVTEYTYPA